MVIRTLAHEVGVAFINNTTNDDVLKILGRICTEEDITELDLDDDYKVSFQKIRVGGLSMNFNVLQLRSDELSRKVLDGFLKRGSICYLGDFMYETDITSVMKRKIIIYAPIENVKGNFKSISKTRSYIDLQCHVEFPSVHFIGNTSVIYDPEMMQLELPTSFSEFEKRLKEIIYEMEIRDEKVENFIRDKLAFIAKATKIYPVELIWRQGVIPDMIREVMDERYTTITRDNALSIMSSEEIENLGLREIFERMEKQDDLVDDTSFNIFDILEKILKPNTSIQFQRAVNTLNKELFKSNVADEMSIKFERLDNKRLIIYMSPREDKKQGTIETFMNDEDDGEIIDIDLELIN